MLGFWSEALQCFNILPAATQSRVSITSTCLAIDTMLQNPEHWRRFASWDEVPGASSGGGVAKAATHISLKRVVASLCATPWSGDAFQTPVLVQTLCKLRAVDRDEAKYVDAVQRVLAQRSQLSLHRKQPNSAYLRFHNVRALLAVVENDMVPTSLAGSPDIGYALERANMVSYDELSRQLAFYFSDDSANFDVIVLAYSLVAYWETSQSLFLGSFARGVVPPTNVKLVKTALGVIFDQQSSDGTWRKGEPIFKVGGGGGSGSGGVGGVGGRPAAVAPPVTAAPSSRDIGNSYVFFFDLVGSMLGPLAQSQPSLLAPYLGNLERCLSWAETNILEEMLPDLCDSTTGRCWGQTVRGWRSNHLDTGGAVAWCTAQVFSAVDNLKALLKKFVVDSVLDEFGGKRCVAAVGGPAAQWDSLMDTDLELGDRTTLKAVVKRQVLDPQICKQRELERWGVRSARVGVDVGTSSSSTSSSSSSSGSGSGSSSNSPAQYSLILFGPPGTAKTTICSAMASYLQWNFVTIDTACFLRDGLEHVAARMSYIFQRLQAVDKTIILFDEIEEFCLDRENPALSMESRLLTTAMLTQLNALRSKQSNIFIVATNRLRSFDAAVTRPGRFDMLLFVGTPNKQARIDRLAKKLQLAGGGGGGAGDNLLLLLECFSSVLDERWPELRFFTFAENEALVNYALVLPGAGADSIKALLSSKIDSILRTATIQGQVKEEYTSSEPLSRA